ncbi:hypothetical protein RND81_08G077800 [Saponaria officinalis]
MLPGVEAARRRRVHQCSNPAGIGAVAPSPSCSSSRRTSFSLFCSNSSSFSLVQQRSRTHHQADEKLGQLAREAKERLDERLRAQRKSPFVTRSNSDLREEISGNERGGGKIKELRTEVYGGGGGRKKGWWEKRGWKAVDQEECAVCLEEFKVGDNLVNMPCAHTFHSTCLVPWLQNNTHCPCCRTSIFS